MITKSDYPKNDDRETDALETRHFYELCYAYRVSLMGFDGFEHIKDFIRENFTPKAKP